MLAEDHSIVKRCQHVDIMHHFSVNRAKRGGVVFEFVKTHENLADFFTKPLQRVKFSQFGDGLGLSSASA
eukprot:313363-Chlamydomonas_euryale.AAC.1